MSDQIDISGRFSHELHQISYKLSQLEDGRIYEFTKIRSDGSLNYNAKKLKEMLVDLFLKIEGKRPSIEEEICKYFGTADS